MMFREAGCRSVKVARTENTPLDLPAWFVEEESPSRESRGLSLDGH